MLNILFADSEINVLNGIKRILHNKRNMWKMFFSESVKQANEIMNNHSIDVVVSDFYFTAEKGEPFLMKVKSNFPTAIRIVYSGEINKEKLYDALFFAHYFLNKPFKSEELRERIESGIKIKESISDNVVLQKLVSSVTKLPSLPKIFFEINELIKKDDFSLKHVADLIEQDVSMSARIIQIVNSGFFGINREITSIFEAVKLIGIATVRSLVLTVNVFAVLKGNRQLEKYLSQIMNHSLLVARGAKKYIEHFTNETNLSELAFIAGLFHDIGKLILFSSEDLRRKIIENYQILNGNRLEEETELFGASHPELGAFLLSLWGMGNDVVEAVAYSHNPDKIDSTKNPLVLSVYLANIAAGILESGEKNADEKGHTDELLKLINLIKE
jgi:putative nucleotidyltransferase with HDIG domain